MSDKILASVTIYVELAIRNEVDIERATVEQERITHFRVFFDKIFDKILRLIKLTPSGSFHEVVTPL